MRYFAFRFRDASRHRGVDWSERLRGAIGMVAGRYGRVEYSFDVLPQDSTLWAGAGRKIFERHTVQRRAPAGEWRGPYARIYGYSGDGRLRGSVDPYDPVALNRRLREILRLRRATCG